MIIGMPSVRPQARAACRASTCKPLSGGRHAFIDGISAIVSIAGRGIMRALMEMWRGGRALLRWLLGTALATLDFSAIMLRSGEEARLPMRSASAVLHGVEGVGVATIDQTAQLSWKPTRSPCRPMRKSC